MTVGDPAYLAQPIPGVPACPLGGPCDLINRQEIMGRPDIAQCRRCSRVYQAAAWVPRVCSECKLVWGDSLHDPCLGTLDGVSEACCGHGRAELAYQVRRP